MNDSEFLKNLRSTFERLDTIAIGGVLLMDETAAFRLERYVDEALVDWAQPPGALRAACSVFAHQLVASGAPSHELAYRGHPTLATAVRRDRRAVATKAAVMLKGCE